MPLKIRQSRGRPPCWSTQTLRMRLQVLQAPTPDDVERVMRPLIAWNLTVAPPEDHRKLVVLASEGDEMVGGAVGHTHWHWLFVSHLWVADQHRGEGLGSRLMGAIEAASVERGARHAHLDTYDFQALPFYERLGDVQFGVLSDYPPGHSRHFLQRALL